MKGSRLKVQTDIIYRSNHLVAATTTSDPKSIKKETGQVLPSSRDLKLTLNHPPPPSLCCCSVYLLVINGKRRIQQQEQQQQEQRCI